MERPGWTVADLQTAFNSSIADSWMKQRNPPLTKVTFIEPMYARLVLPKLHFVGYGVGCPANYLLEYVLQRQNENVDEDKAARARKMICYKRYE
jgi:hypothetical protein